MRRYAFEACLVHVIWFLLLFSVCDGWSMPIFGWLESFHQWDARWYASIAYDGHGLQPQSYAFSPGFGWILRYLTGAAIFLTNASWAHAFYSVSFATSMLSFAVGNAIFVWLSHRRWKIDRPRLWLAAIANPVGYFAFCAYSDMFFYALLMATLALALATSDRADLWGFAPASTKRPYARHAALVALLVTLPWIRLTGFAMASWLVARRNEALAVLASLAGFLAYFWIRTDHALFFLAPQPIFGMPDGNGLKGLASALDVLVDGLAGRIGYGFEFFLHWIAYGAMPILIIVLMVALTLWLISRREFLLALAVISIALMSHNQALWRSTPRYMLPFFPWLAWTIFAKRKSPQTTYERFAIHIGFALWLGLCFTGQVIFATAFRNGGWGF